MILQALTAYYEQLREQKKVEAPGWDSKFKVSYELRLGPDGQLLALNDLRQEVPKGKKTVIAPRELPVPHRVKRASGVAANFLCDNTSYLLGADEKGKPERSRQCFEACAALHHKVLDGVDSPAAKAILAFFDSWEPDTAPTHPLLAEQWADLNNNANLVFGYESPDGAHWLATTDDAIRAAWQSAFDTSDADAETARCLITGKEAGIARIHPAIKGVMGAQAAGAALVSFNAPAFCSYGHEQGANAPVSEYAAFAYTTALNLLLADRNCCQRIGDTTIVCWAENAAPAYSNAMLMFFCGGAEARGVSESDLAAALKALSQGRPVSFLDDKLDPNQNFYVLGISPNAARLSVRFFLHSSFGQFAKNLQDHADRLSITRPAFDKWENLSVWALAQETVNQKSRDKTPSPQLVGDLLRAILTGGPYPRHSAQRRDPPHPGRTGSHPGPRRHPESLLSPQLPHRAQQGGIYREPERKQQCPLCSGASLLCAGDDPERRQSRHQRHHQRPVLQLGLCHPGNGLPYAGQAGSEASAEDEHPQRGAFQQTAHRADGPAARDRLPGAAQPAGAGCL